MAKKTLIALIALKYKPLKERKEIEKGALSRYFKPKDGIWKMDGLSNGPIAINLTKFFRKQ